MAKIKNLRSLFTFLMVAMLSLSLSSCGSDDEGVGSQSEIIQNLMSHKWTGSSTDYDVYSYGGATYTQTWTVYFTSESEGVMHVVAVDRDSSLGTSKVEEHLDFSYSVDGNKIRLYGESNFVFDYYGSYMMEGDDIFEASSLTSSDYSYLQDHKDGYHGKAGSIDTNVYVMSDDEMLMAAGQEENGWYSYFLQFGFGAVSDDAYRKGMTQMRLTVWADNGCLDNSYKTSNYGKKKVYTLYLSSTVRDWFDYILVWSKDSQITFNYELEYYNSKDGLWREIKSHKITFSTNSQ